MWSAVARLSWFSTYATSQSHTSRGEYIVVSRVCGHHTKLAAFDKADKVGDLLLGTGLIDVLCFVSVVVVLGMNAANQRTRTLTGRLPCCRYQRLRRTFCLNMVCSRYVDGGFDGLRSFAGGEFVG